MPKRPSVTRFFAVAFAVLLSNSASAQDERGARALTDQDLVQRALTRPEFQQVAASGIERERGRAAAAGSYSNPQVLYMREQTYDRLGTGEDYLSAAQVIDLGGRRRMTRQGGAARVRAREFEERDERVQLAAEVRQRFYECLSRQARVRALEGWSQQIDRAFAVVSRRAERGDAAAYDRVRLGRERTLALSRVAAERALVSASKQRLAALVALEPAHFSLVGSLLPEAPPPDLNALDARLRTRPDFMASAQAERAARLDAKAAGRLAVPDLRLEAGYKGVRLNSGGRTQGFMAGAALTVPLFDQGKGARRAADAQAREHAAGRALAFRQQRGELAATHETAVVVYDAATRFRAAALAGSTDVVRIATAGYEGGEMGIFELLDAYRGAAEDELTALELELTARRAEIELERLTGRGLP